MGDAFRFERMRQISAGRAAYAVILSLVCMIVSCRPSQPAGGGTSTATTTTQPTFHPMDEGDVPITITGGSIDLDFDRNKYPGSGTTSDPFSRSGYLTGLWICDDQTGDCAEYDKQLISYDTAGNFTITATDSKKNTWIQVVAHKAPATITVTINNPDLKPRHNNLKRKLYDKGMNVDTLTVVPALTNCCSIQKGKFTIVIGVHS